MHRLWKHARTLRNHATDAERRLWASLRRRHLNGWKFRRQYPLKGYIVDFVCIDARLVIELDGGQHVDQAAYDAHRSRKLAEAGYQVLRFWNDDVLVRTTAVLEEIYRHLPDVPGDED